MQGSLELIVYCVSFYQPSVAIAPALLRRHARWRSRERFESHKANVSRETLIESRCIVAHPQASACLQR